MKIPKLRFKEFSDSWEEKSLNDIFKRITNKNTENNDNVLTISAQYGLISQTDFFNKSVAGKDLTKYYLLNKNDFAYNKSYSTGYPMGTIKRLKKYDKGIVSTLYICFRNRGNDNLDFLEQLFESKKIDKNIRDIAQEGARNHGLLNIGINDFFDIEVKVPILPEQKKIGDFLSSIDKKISLKARELELTKLYKKGIMQKIFSQKLRFKDNNGNSYPEWTSTTLGEIATFSRGKLISKEDITENGIECIRYGELYTYYTEVIDKIKSKTNINISELVLSEKNDIIIPTSGETALEIAKASCVLKSGVALGGDLNIIKTKENGIFLSYYLNNKLKNDIASLAQGASIVHLYDNHLKLLVLNLPCLEEQRKIGDFLSSIDKKIELLSSELENLKLFKKGLLQRMFV